MDPSDHRINRAFDCISVGLLGENLQRMVLFDVWYGENTDEGSEA